MDTSGVLHIGGKSPLVQSVFTNRLMRSGVCSITGNAEVSRRNPAAMNDGVIKAFIILDRFKR